MSYNKFKEIRVIQDKNLLIYINYDTQIYIHRNKGPKKMKFYQLVEF